jgi:hypothetical protein
MPMSAQLRLCRPQDYADVLPPGNSRRPE